MAVATAMTDLQLLLCGLRAAPACLVTVDATEGSAPRAAGAWMAVFADHLVGSIGGGNLEHTAIAQARRQLAQGAPAQARTRCALGPGLGQCCGGVVHLGFALAGSADAPRLAQRLAPRLQPLALFGAGHVGSALARVLAPLPFALTWVDSRDGIFPQPAPGAVVCELSDPVQHAVPTLAAGSGVLIMSFSHAQDLDILAACLQRQRSRSDLSLIGLIGSQTKWARFAARLRQRGFAPGELAHVSCPIGLPTITGKEPEVIAIAVAAQLLQNRTGSAPAPGLPGPDAAQ